MADHTTQVPFTPMRDSNDWTRCVIHGNVSTTRETPIPCQCVVNEMGYAIHFGDSTAIRRLASRGISVNRICHMGTSFKGMYPLGLVTSDRYHHRSDDCFLALLEAGADPKSQAKTKEDLSRLKDQLMGFAFRPNAGLNVLKAVLKMGVADAESARDRLVEFATRRFWYDGPGPDGQDIIAKQDEFLQVARKCMILRTVRLSDEQIARFWTGAWPRPATLRAPPETLMGYARSRDSSDSLARSAYLRRALQEAMDEKDLRQRNGGEQQYTQILFQAQH